MQQKNKKPRRNIRPRKLIDLFCGAGGLSLGFSPRFSSEFTSVWANDFNESAAKTAMGIAPIRRVAPA